MNTKEVKYPLMESIAQISAYIQGDAVRRMFPNTVFTDGGLGRLHSCVGFLRGLAASGRIDDAEKLAKTLFHAFRLGMVEDSDNKVDPASLKMERPLMSSKPYWPQMNRLVVEDDGSFLSFSFAYYGIMQDQTVEGEGRMMKDDSDVWGIKYKYSLIYDGGIIFHGLSNTYCVTIGNEIGWQSHT